MGGRTLAPTAEKEPEERERASRDHPPSGPAVEQLLFDEDAQPGEGIRQSGAHASVFAEALGDDQCRQIFHGCRLMISHGAIR